MMADPVAILLFTGLVLAALYVAPAAPGPVGDVVTLLLPPGRGCGRYTDSRPLRRQRRPDPAEFVRGALRRHPNRPGWEVGRLFRTPEVA